MSPLNHAALDLAIRELYENEKSKRNPRHLDTKREADWSTLGNYWGGSYTTDPNWREGNVWHTAIPRKPWASHRADSGATRMSVVLLTREQLGKIIWDTSQRDEGSISAAGANVIADAILLALTADG